MTFPHESTRRPPLLPRRSVKQYLPWLLIPLLAFAWFWFFRANTWNGGDSEQWEREIAGGVWLRKRQMLSFFCMQLSYQVTNRLWGWTAHLAINLTSCLAGAVAALVSWRMFHNQRWGGWAFGIMMTSGFTTLFYGHIETYAMPVAALLFHWLALKRVTERRWSLWVAPATFLLTMLFHLVVLFALPALVLFMAREVRLRGLRVGQLQGVAAWFAAVGAVVLVLRNFLGSGEMVGPHFVMPLGQLLSQPWLVFSHPTLPLKGLILWWTAGGAAALVLPAGVAAARRRYRRWDHALILYLLCFLGFALVWAAEMGARDFDLFCFPGVAASVLVARRVMLLPARSVAVGLTLGVNLILWAERPLLWAEVGNRGTATVLVEAEGTAGPAHLLLDDRQPLLRENRFVRSGVHSVLAVNRGKPVPRRFFRVEGGEVFLVVITEGDLRISRLK